MFTILSCTILAVYLVALKFGNGEETTPGSCSFSGSEPQLLFSNNTHILLTALDSDNSRVLVETMTSSVSFVDYHFTDGSIYWSDQNKQTISRKTCPLGDENSIIETIIQNSKAMGIAVDSLNDHLYWADEDRAAIKRSRLNGSSIEVILDESLQSPVAITIDTSNRWLYFSDHGRHTIEKCKFDGSSRQTLISDDIQTPYGLALDLNSKRLYWTDSALYHIKSSNLDGTDVKLVSIDRSSLVGISIVVMGIDLYGSYMYVSNLGTGIYRIQKNKQNAVPHRISGTHHAAYGVKMIKSHSDTSDATTMKGSARQMIILFAGILFVEFQTFISI
ncbi:very low-density lipoprotein receptor-like [Mytilus edulis]|uniref:very low-density lipoprotein receptor-like n=1 Tax=Mytilus edulis TaxID=6550 RepID=UPI0039EE82C1